jgi:hypothetical protein
MAEKQGAIRQPSEKEFRSILKALASSGILAEVDTVSQEEGKRRLLEQLSREGLTKVHPDILVCNNVHYVFVVAPIPPDPPEE